MSSSDQNAPSPSDDADYAKSFDFSTASIRQGFIRKVYGLLSLQLIVTFGIVLLFCLHPTVKEYTRNNLWILLVAIVVEFVTIMALCCCEAVRRTHPTNLIFMALFTLGTAICVGYVGASYSVEDVLIALGLTAIMVIGLTLFALQTKWDFTKMGGGLFIALLLFTVVAIVASIMRSNYATMILAYVGVVLFSIYLIHDTQLIIGGNHRYEMSPEEYVLGAITLYLDIVRIFMYLLRIVAAAKS
ncbi:protein lifeguard 1-like [Sitodiplosis mosellana]|uniref:protein lifeguard 1-like n=1 Tax=Sitodiplosis mosellana TaxID=263140 RepID=UPI0024449AFF|nr:protein lifeguard 1-like [Sitodiplosis mosellana]XP_055311517.1 protein lifeguard 1-like [Sitodiplosis mosellana]XP_055311518.1 protein lifeguard 1-like [Sitodiplosis mosellana]